MAKRATATTTKPTNATREAIDRVQLAKDKVQLAKELVLLAITIGAALGPIIGFANGALSLSGIGILGSKFFWSVYSLLLITAVTGYMDWRFLRWSIKRLGARDWRITSPPTGYYIICHVVWYFFFLPYIFAVGQLASEVEYPALPGFGVALVVVVGIPFAGWGIAEMAHQVDRMVNPWDHHFE